jgi:hypothetical protein
MTDTVISDAPQRSKARTIPAVILFVIASLLFPIGVLAFWGQNSITDTEQYVATVAPLASDPTVQDTVSNLVATEVTSSIDIGAALKTYLPANGQVLVGPLTAALNGLIDKAVHAIMGRPKFQELWVKVNQEAQTSFIRLLEGDESGPMKLANGEVVLDTTSVYQAVRQQLIDDQVVFADKLPATPPNDHQIVLFQSAQLERIQTIYKFTHPIATWLIFLAIALFIISILLAIHHARFVLATGIVVLLTSILIKEGLSIGSDQVTLALQGTPLATGEAAFFEILTRYLVNVGWWLFVIGLVLIVCGWLFGGSRPATAIRHWFSTVGREDETAVTAS